MKRSGPRKPQRLRVGTSAGSGSALQRQVDSIVDSVRAVVASPVMGGNLLQGVVVRSDRDTVVEHGLGRDYRDFFVGRNSHGHTVMEIEDPHRPRDRFLVLRTVPEQTSSYSLATQTNPAWGFIGHDDTNGPGFFGTASGSWSELSGAAVFQTSSLNRVNVVGTNGSRLGITQPGWYRLDYVASIAHSSSGNPAYFTRLYDNDTPIDSSLSEAENTQRAMVLAGHTIRELASGSQIGLRVNTASGQGFTIRNIMIVAEQLLTGSTAGLGTTDPAATYTTASIWVL